MCKYVVCVLVACGNLIFLHCSRIIYSSEIKNVCMWILIPAVHQVLKYVSEFAHSIITAFKRQTQMFARVTYSIIYKGTIGLSILYLCN